MLSTIVSLLGGKIVDRLFGSVNDTIARFQQRKITEVEAKKELQLSLISVVKDVETAHADLIAKTYATLMGVVEKSRLVAIVWAVAAVSQLAVLLWHQVGIPLLTYGYMEWWGEPKFRYPSSGTTVDWAYALLGGLLGLGALALRGGPGASSIVDRFKSLTK